MKIAITGSNGQIGSYLCDIFKKNGHEIYGFGRSQNSKNIIDYISGDITKIDDINDFVTLSNPDIFINCAAQSNVVKSFDNPEYTAFATGNSVLNCLNILRHFNSKIKFITLGSSEMFGHSGGPWTEESKFNPQSPYANAKVHGHEITKIYRKDYNIPACNAICFNSESPRRSSEYVSKKIVKTAANIKNGLEKKLKLGNILSYRDWSHASDTAEAIYKMAISDNITDYIISSGEAHSVKEFVEKVFKHLNLDWTQHVVLNSTLFRQNDNSANCYGVSDKIRKELNWEPKYNFDSLIKDMILAEG